MKRLIICLWMLFLSAPVWANAAARNPVGALIAHGYCSPVFAVVLMLNVLLLPAGVATGVISLFGYRCRRLLLRFFMLSFFLTPIFLLTFGGLSVAVFSGLSRSEAYFKGLSIFPLVWGLVGLVASIGGIFGRKAGYGKKMWSAVATSCLTYLLIGIPLIIGYFYYFDQVCDRWDTLL